MKIRTETDTLGTIDVDDARYWGAQTQRSLENFRIGGERMPMELLRAFAVLKKAAALTNADLTDLPMNKAQAIAGACDDLLEGVLDDEFPLVVWQTGSGTHTNMNVNEVVANRATERMGGDFRAE
ncbi:MAG: fumarate hydratase class II, partial [Myxococcota bacterium]